MSSTLNIHRGYNNAHTVTLESNSYDPATSESAILFHTITVRYGDSTVTLFMEDDEALVNALNSIIDGAQAKLDSMLVASA